MRYAVYLILYILLICSGYSKTKIKSFAFCLESKGEIIRSGLTRNGNLLKGDVIYEEDKITVGHNSYVSFINIFERSEVRLFENSSVKILESNKHLISTNEVNEIVLFGGKVIIDKIDLNDKALVITSPSSIVFSKNSHFLIEYRSKPFYSQSSYCILTSIKGNILIENLDSKKMIFLNGGGTIISTNAGKFYPLETFRSSINIDNTLINKN